jgi:hypothetical protein
MGAIRFEGDPPYALPVAQEASANPEGEGVALTLRVIVPGKPPSLVPIRVQMTFEVAQHLLAQLVPAMRMAEQRARR